MAASADVKALQSYLARFAAHGYTTLNPGAVDGVMGAKTFAALMAALRLAAQQASKEAVRASANATVFALTALATQTSAQTKVYEFATAHASEILATLKLALVNLEPPATLGPSWLDSAIVKGVLVAGAATLGLVVVSKFMRPRTAQISRTA